MNMNVAYQIARSLLLIRACILQILVLVDWVKVAELQKFERKSCPGSRLCCHEARAASCSNCYSNSPRLCLALARVCALTTYRPLLCNQTLPGLIFSMTVFWVMSPQPWHTHNATARTKQIKTTDAHSLCWMYWLHHAQVLMRFCDEIWIPAALVGVLDANNNRPFSHHAQRGYVAKPDQTVLRPALS